jgi:hypothetical protein
MGSDDLDGRRLEEDWHRALDAAGDAVSENARTKMLTSSEAADATERIRGERKWLGGFRSSLHRLFPRRGRGD